MTPLFKKLLYKNQSSIYVLQAPSEFRPEIDVMMHLCEVKTKPSKKLMEFVMVFVTKQTEIDTLAPTLVASLAEDGVLYFCYPKGTSKKYTCDFNRDNGWQILGKLGFEPVRMVAVDENWSALRFRKVEHIKKMTRSFAMTEEGKRKAGKS